MPNTRPVQAALAALALSACVSTAPVDLADDHPASPKAPAGLIGTPTALEQYKTSEDFAARAAAEGKIAPSGGHAGHGGVPK